jgi:Zn-finger nucleic acid-binding protein
MPVCPNCLYEYIEGITICPDCNAVLVDSGNLPKFEDLSEKDWALIFTTDEEYKADMIKDYLESAGIESMIMSQKDRNFPAPGNLTIVKLFVRKEDMPDALSFIQELGKDKQKNGEDSFE